VTGACPDIAEGIVLAMAPGGTNVIVNYVSNEVAVLSLVEDVEASQGRLLLPVVVKPLRARRCDEE